MKRWPINEAYFWETAPFFRILLPFVAGILCYERGWLYKPDGTFLVVVTSAAFLLYAMSVFVFKAARTYLGFSFLLLNVILFFAGMSVSYYNDARHDAEWFGNNISEKKSYVAVVTGLPTEKEHSWKLPVAVIGAVKESKVRTVSGKAFLYLYKDEFPMQFHKGDTVLLPGKWEVIRNPGNPFEFDYAGYCRRDNICYQQSCEINNVRLFGSGDPNALPVIDRTHDWCMQQLDRYLADAKTRGLIQAMLLGDEINLDEDLRQSYSETGIVHIIAISGGNVAIFFIVISALLWWLRDKKYLWIKYAVALPFVWFYVMVAGAPPSAVRAAIMFSLLAFSVMLEKNNNSLNTLFATAFLLLCAQPMWLFSVGFQLSFVAVLSLILFYGPIYKWLSPATKVTGMLWATVAASLAAELLAAPLVVYYFHTFPLLFIVANVAAYLFMGLVLILGIAIVGVSWIPALAKCLGVVTVWIVTVFDRIVNWLQSCNPVSFHFLMLTGVETLLVYAVIGCIVLFLIRQQKQALFAGMAAACVLWLCFCNDEWRRLNQQRFVVYSLGKVEQAELIEGDRYTVLVTDTGSRKRIDYAVKPAHIGWRAWRQDSVDHKELFNINGKSVLVPHHEINPDDHFHVDYLIVTGSDANDPLKLKRVFTPRVVVISNSSSKKSQDKQAQAFLRAGMQVHIVGRDGAFVLD